MQVPLKILSPFALLFAVLLLTACSMFGGEKKDETEGWSEDRLYNEAKGLLDSGQYKSAAEDYEKLQTRYPFGPHSQQAQLDMAYAYFKEDEYASAVAACDRFLKLYPGSPAVDYAHYLKGLANYNQNKGLLERFLPTDTAQRDQGAAVDSFNDFSELLKKYPDSKYSEDARQRMVHLRDLLARQEVNIANYYMRRGAYVAAANRARYVVENYQQTTSMPEALTIMAKAYKVLQMDDLSNDALRVLELNFPNHPGIEEVRNTVVR
ncbi:MAG TPA: outer membrane protein assembly factor BamD [Gammaproteobacteria bacterium]|nr:outer membrane protein assembly factor BamD [Gammaproteobacteria bacterium]